MFDLFNFSKRNIKIEYDVITVDDKSGFSSFPNPDDSTKFLLPTLIDNSTEDDSSTNSREIDAQDNSHNHQTNLNLNPTSFWMPDNLCKVCYSCEVPFSMYRRRHHCRLCGQIFCNKCSNYTVDSSVINLSSDKLVRVCRLCHDQLPTITTMNMSMTVREPNHKGETSSIPIKSKNKRIIDSSLSKRLAYIITLFFNYLLYTLLYIILSIYYYIFSFNYIHVYDRAADHLEAIVTKLIESTPLIHEAPTWHNVIINLIRKAIAVVDPAIKGGDSIDIRPYVKLKVSLQ